MSTSIMCLLLDPWRKRQRASALEETKTSNKNITENLDADQVGIAKWNERCVRSHQLSNSSYQLYSWATIIRPNTWLFLCLEIASYAFEMCHIASNSEKRPIIVSARVLGSNAHDIDVSFIAKHTSWHKLRESPRDMIHIFVNNNDHVFNMTRSTSVSFLYLVMHIW